MRVCVWWEMIYRTPAQLFTRRAIDWNRAVRAYHTVGVELIALAVVLTVSLMHDVTNNISFSTVSVIVFCFNLYQITYGKTKRPLFTGPLQSSAFLIWADWLNLPNCWCNLLCEIGIFQSPVYSRYRWFRKVSLQVLSHVPTYSCANWAIYWMHELIPVVS